MELRPPDKNDNVLSLSGNGNTTAISPGPRDLIPGQLIHQTPRRTAAWEERWEKDPGPGSASFLSRAHQETLPPPSSVPRRGRMFLAGEIRACSTSKPESQCFLSAGGFGWRRKAGFRSSPVILPGKTCLVPEFPFSGLEKAELTGEGTAGVCWRGDALCHLLWKDSLNCALPPLPGRSIFSSN